MNPNDSSDKIGLKRSVGLFLLTMYGLGTILGAGIYVLVGEIAGFAGMAAPASFVIACIVASLTALSYAELAARLPKSAGEAAYADAAFGSKFLSQSMGWAVILVGTVSAATMCRGLVGYAEIFVDIAPAILIILTVVSLSALAIWGIQQALWAAAIVTVIELIGLVLVCVAASDALATLPTRVDELLPLRNTEIWAGVVAGAFVAFYAFIGFEDMVNIAEEVRNPRRTVPMAIVLSLCIATIIYFLVSAAAVLSVAPERLANSTAPLATVVAESGYSTGIIAAISLLAVLNGGLVQLIMASRVLYGMASMSLLWRGFALLNPRTQTPIVATISIAAAVLCLALFFSLSSLAQATSSIALIIFCVVNLSLIQLKRSPSKVSFQIPMIIPVIGLLCSLAMLIQQIA